VGNHCGDEKTSEEGQTARSKGGGVSGDSITKRNPVQSGKRGGDVRIRESQTKNTGRGGEGERNKRSSKYTSGDKKDRSRRLEISDCMEMGCPTKNHGESTGIWTLGTLERKRERATERSSRTA